MLKLVGDRLSVGVSPEVLPILFVNDLSSLPTLSQALPTTAIAPLFSVKKKKKITLYLISCSFKPSMVGSVLCTDTYLCLFQILKYCFSITRFWH